MTAIDPKRDTNSKSHECLPLRFQLAKWSASIFISLILSITFIFTVVELAASNYESKYPQVMGEDDLAYGLTVLMWFSGAVIVSIPICVSLIVLFNRMISKYIKSNL